MNYDIVADVFCTQNDMEQHVGGLSVPSEEFYAGFVTWLALEDALRGSRDSQLAEPMSSEPGVIEKSVTEVSNQADQVSRDKGSLTVSQRLRYGYSWSQWEMAKYYHMQNWNLWADC